MFLCVFGWFLCSNIKNKNKNKKYHFDTFSIKKHFWKALCTTIPITQNQWQKCKYDSNMVDYRKSKLDLYAFISIKSFKNSNYLNYMENIF
jgi:hypothetical protein